MVALVERESLAAKRARIAEETLALGRIRSEQNVRRHILQYFSDVQVPAGVDILSRRYLDMCLESDTCGAVDAAYRSMKAQNRFQGSCGDGTMGEDVRLVIRLLKGIRAKCVPQEFSPGILLMHLEILEGIQF
jgi:hypothetical protein